MLISPRPGPAFRAGPGFLFSVVGFALALLFAGELRAHSGHVESGSEESAASATVELPAPGYGSLAFPAPEAGSYELPVLGEAGNGDVLDDSGQRRRLSEFYGDKLAVLSFVYRACPDSNGCPLANFVLGRVQARMSEDPRLADNVRLVSISMDPEHDTPEAMREFGKTLRKPPAEWEFLTTDSVETLDPLLEDYGQSVVRDYDENGNYIGSLSHILRVFLIDRDSRIRNIYTVSYLHADTLVADIETVLMDEADAELLVSTAGAAPDAMQSPALHGAGDVKDGYESGDYETRSQGLPARRGRKAKLFSFVTNTPLGLPEQSGVGVTAQKIDLGRKLFFDRRLSHNGTISCAMCHVPEQGFASNEMATAVGIEGRTVRRNSPTLYNVAHAKLLFHDGRESRLEQQVWGPLLAKNEMGNPSVGFVLDTIASQKDYEAVFERAFDGRGASMETVGLALAAYERSLVSAGSPFDRWRYGGDADAISVSAQRGFDLFSGEAGCSGCHLVGEKFSTFADGDLHNTGVGYRQTMRKTPAEQEVPVAPGRRLRIDTSAIASSSETPPSDIGRYEITEDPSDRWKYKTPSLRNVALTAPYMHDGSIATLRAVVEFYDGGGVANEELAAAIRPLGLDELQKSDLVAFLQSLTGDNVDVLIADAFAAPVGEPN